QYRTRLHPDGSLTVTDPAGSRTHVPVPSPTTSPRTQGILFGAAFPTLEADRRTQAWFAARLGAVRLLYLDDPATSRRIDLEDGPADASISLVDGYPILLTTTASLAALNHHLTHDRVTGDPQSDHLPMERSRPNLVISGTRPWEEDGWRRIKVGEAVFKTVEPCGRCVVITIDQETGERRGSAPLKALARHHRLGDKLAFGLSLVPERPAASTGDLLGTLRLGDEVTVLGVTA
ncbi:MOSC domain-containing protein, partial [Lysinibacillus fusiformis]|uniref:MOSC domain-containing protein n=2 Tax=Bacillati TaxID=1783272 RepID=UPI00381C556F